MDGRRQVFRAVLPATTLLVVSVLWVGDPASAHSRDAGQRGTAAPAIVPRGGHERPVSDLAPLAKIDPAVASDGSTSLVVWSDYLTGPVPQLRAARRNASGAVLGEFAVSPSTAVQSSPSVAFNGTNFFVVWEEAGDLFGTRVTTAGVVLDQYGIPVAISRAGDLSTPAVASNGSDFLVSWIGRGSSTGDSVLAKRVTAGGTVLDGPGFEVGSAGLYGGLTGGGPAVAFNGTSYLVVWSSDDCPFCGTLLGSRVTTTGAVVNPGGFPISKDNANQYFNETAPSVGATGSQFVVGWTAERCEPPGDCRASFDSDVLAGRVSAGGTVLGTSNIAVAVGDGFAGEVSVASTGATALIVWADARTGARDVYAARIGTTGPVTDPSGKRVSTNGSADREPVVTRSGSTFVLAWQSGLDIVGAALTESGAVTRAPAVVSTGHAPGQSAPDLAWDGNEVVAVWRESRAGVPDTIRFGRAFPDGEPTSGEGTIIASGFDLGDPVISSSGQQQLIVWPQNGKIYGARLQLGDIVDTAPIVVSPTRPDFSFPRSPAVTWNGSAYLVTWADADGGSLGVFGARVDRSAAVLDPTGITIASAPGDQDFPAVASNGTDALVVWHDTRGSSGSDIFGTRVTRAGAVSNPEGRSISAAAGDQSYPDVAWNGSGYVAVWQDARGGSSDIYGARLSAAGTVADASGTPISTAANDQSRPTVSRALDEVLVVWEDRRGLTGVDLRAARMKSSGVVRDPSGVVISDLPTDEVDPAVAYLGRGRVEVGYQRTASEARYRSDRVFLRTVSTK